MARQEATSGTPRLELGEAIEEYPLSEEQQGFVGLQVLPIFETNEKKATVTVVTRESILRECDVKRNSRSAYARDEVSLNEIEYACQEYGREEPVDEDEAAHHATEFDSGLLATSLNRIVLLREQEKRIAAQIFNDTTWDSGNSDLYTDITGGDDWDVVGADIIAEVETARQQVRANCGIFPDTMLINVTHMNSFRLNTQILDAVKYTNTVTASQMGALLSPLFDIPKVIFAGGIKNTANEGQSLTSGNIWSNLYCWMGVTSDGPTLKVPQTGRTMLWTGSSPSNLTIESYHEDQTRSDIYRARQYTDEAVFDAYFGHLLKIDT